MILFATTNLLPTWATQCLEELSAWLQYFLSDINTIIMGDLNVTIDSLQSAAHTAKLLRLPLSASPNGLTPLLIRRANDFVLYLSDYAQFFQSVMLLSLS